MADSKSEKTPGSSVLLEYYPFDPFQQETLGQCDLHPGYQPTSGIKYASSSCVLENLCSWELVGQHGQQSYFHINRPRDYMLPVSFISGGFFGEEKRDVLAPKLDATKRRWLDRECGCMRRPTPQHPSSHPSVRRLWGQSEKRRKCDFLTPDSSSLIVTVGEL
jgi:hypothetical protein